MSPLADRGEISGDYFLHIKADPPCSLYSMSHYEFIIGIGLHENQTMSCHFIQHVTTMQLPSYKSIVHEIIFGDIAVM